MNLKFKINTISFLLLFNLSWTQTNKLSDSLIVWSEDNKLEWKDFIMNNPVDDIDQFNNHAALGTVSINYNLKRIKLDDIDSLSVFACFNKNDSWTVTTDKEVLKHEQLHFDIVELFVRKIRKGFDALKKSKEKNIQKYYDVYNVFFEEIMSYQFAYDKEIV